MIWPKLLFQKEKKYGAQRGPGRYCHEKNEEELRPYDKTVDKEKAIENDKARKYISKHKNNE